MPGRRSVADEEVTLRYNPRARHLLAWQQLRAACRHQCRDEAALLRLDRSHRTFALAFLLLTAALLAVKADELAGQQAEQTRLCDGHPQPAACVPWGVATMETSRAAVGSSEKSETGGSKGLEIEPEGSDTTHWKANDRLNTPGMEVPPAASSQAGPMGPLALKTLLRLPAWLDLELEHRSRYETYDRPLRRSEAGGDQQLAQRTRLRLNVREILGPVKVLLEVEDARAHLTDAGSTITDSHVNKFDVLQFQLEITTRRAFGRGLPVSLAAGRMTMDLGMRRFVARNRFRNTTNAFDGFSVTLGDSNRWELRSFLVNPVLRLFTSLDRRDRQTLFWGSYFASRKGPRLSADVYYFGLHDSAERQDVRRRLSTFGVRLFKNPNRGEIDYELESAWQIGKLGALRHVAHLQAAEAGYTVDAAWSPRWVAQLQYASGDRDPTDNRSGTFDTLFGARRFDFGPTGIWGPFYRSNIVSPGYRIVLAPGKDLEWAAGHRLWWLAQSRDAWVESGFRDPSGKSGRFLGNHVETWVRWTASSNVVFDVGAAYWAKGSFVKSVAASSADLAKSSRYFYAATEIRF